MISILTLTYQRHKILEEAIQSYLSQDFEGESEMVIINDSPDVEYVYNHPNIRIINCKERFKSISEKLEYGYKQCKYDYIYRLDDDDLLTPFALSLVTKNILENSNYDIYRSEKHYFMENNKFIDISSNINTGNIYSKKYLDNIIFPKLSFKEDYFITYEKNAKILNFNSDKYTMIYRWGIDTYHISDIAYDLPGRPTNLTNEERLILTDGKIKEREYGIIRLIPSFKNDYYSQIF